MIFADKLIDLRKKNGWSQEELAEMLNVTRQSVSKWESAQSIPDLSKIVKMSEIFSVSTDYLLKDKIEEKQTAENLTSNDFDNVIKVSMEDANEFLRLKNESSEKIAFAVLLCILSPVCLIFLAGISEYGLLTVSDNFAAGLGLIVLMIFVAVAVGIFIHEGSKTNHFEYLEKEVFETAYGVEGMVREQKQRFKPIYTKNMVLGVVMCILSVIPIFAGIMSNASDGAMAISVCALLVVIAVGVMFIVRVDTVWDSFNILLQTEDFSVKNKKNHKAAFMCGYWLIITAIYCGYSLVTDKWYISWVIWPVAGIFSPVYSMLIDMFSKNK